MVSVKLYTFFYFPEEKDALKNSFHIRITTSCFLTYHWEEKNESCNFLKLTLGGCTAVFSRAKYSRCVKVFQIQKADVMRKSAMPLHSFT